MNVRIAKNKNNKGGAMITQIRTLSPGFLLAALVGLAAQGVGNHYDAPVMLFALLFGIALSFLHARPNLQPGIDWTGRTVLRLGIGLLGIRIAFQDLFALGWTMAAVIVSGIVTTIFLGVFLAKWMKLRTELGILTGGAVGICGASAAMAISAVLPNHKSKEQETVLAIIGVTALSTAAMVLYPLVASFFGLDEHQAGIFFGGAIHDVAQVVGAGYSVSEGTGDLATLTKLVRVSLLVPVVMALLFWFRKRHAEAGEGKVPGLPLFLIGFFALMLLNSLVDIPPVLKDATATLSRFALVFAIAAIGVKSHLQKLLTLGLKPVLLMTLETLWLTGWVLLAVLYLV
jgi:uncharacterized integral membrane protein (TIGR00698 family)